MPPHDLHDPQAGRPTWGIFCTSTPTGYRLFDLTFGKAHVFYPEASEERCTAALLLDIDPVALVRGRGTKGSDGLLTQYVNDRPYVASSFLSVAIARVFGSALGGRSREPAGGRRPAHTALRDGHRPSLPRRRRGRPPPVRAPRLPGVPGGPRVLPAGGRLGTRPLPQPHRRRPQVPGRSSRPPLRPDPGARQRQALLGGGR